MSNALISLDVMDICRPFFHETGLNAFSYSRVFKDGTRSELWSDAAAFDHTFHKARYIVGAYTPQYFSQNERYSFLERKVETYPKGLRERYCNQLMDQRDYFDHGHCFSILNQKQEYCEYFLFYAPPSNGMAINFYFNNIDKLEAFSSNFLKLADKLIVHADKYKLCNIRNFSDNNNTSSPSVINSLTLREKDVAKSLITGATAKEIGMFLGISHRTVESHLEKMKLKMGCTKKSDLVRTLHTHNQLLD